MPITRLEMVSSAFHSQAKRDRNAGETQPRSERGFHVRIAGNLVLIRLISSTYTKERELARTRADPRHLRRVAFRFFSDVPRGRVIVKICKFGRLREFSDCTIADSVLKVSASGKVHGNKFPAGCDIWRSDHAIIHFRNSEESGK